MIGLIIGGVIVLILVIMYFAYNNKEVALRKEAEAQKGKIESVFDTMWKTIKQEAGVTEEYRKTFEKIYPELIAGRYSGDNQSLIKMIQESNPEFNTSLYQKLMQTIEVVRKQFDVTVLLSSACSTSSASARHSSSRCLPSGSSGTLRRSNTW